MRAVTRLAALIVVVAVCAACTSSGNPASSSSVAAPSGSSASATPTPTLRPVPSTRVPAPQSGNLTSTVPSRTVRTLAPVALSSPASFDSKVSARLVQVRRTQVKAKLPGEVSGPGLSVTASFTNHSKSAVSMAQVVVNVSDARGTPLVLIESGSSRVAGSLSPGRTKSGVYVFDLSTGFRDPATISVSYSAAAPVILFVGKA